MCTYVWRGLFCFGLSVWATSVAAIPSPELIIGSAASVSQLFGMGAAVLGGGAVLARRQLKSKAAAKSMRRFKYAVIALVLVCLGLAAANVYQYQTHSAQELAHLQSTLSRPAVIHDATLKELSFSDQTKNELSISTDEVDALIRSDQPVTLIDVRETAENSMGTIPGARHIRFPDVDPNADIFHNGPVVLLCHNGNRSSETCAKLAALGIDCRFIEGGIEKWIVEQRPFSDPNVRGLADLRAIPAYPNKTVLFNTPDIHALIETDTPVFVDVRYPGDFATGHLPGAINIPLRAAGTEQLNAMIAQLPDAPIVAACYDRRGCFISQVLGYELAQKGFDFRGRYTVPWEYFVPPATKPHVAEFMAHANRSLWQKSIDVVAAALIFAGDRIGFLTAVGALALVTRILILPVALKSERDQIVLKAKRNELNAIKHAYKEDPAQKAEQLREFYNTHGVTPMRNALALLFLPITMIGISAVQKTSDGQVGLAWIDNLGQPDPAFVLPAVAAVLGVIYLLQSFAGSMRRNALITVLGFVGVFGLSFALSAGASFYLIVALGLLILQRLWVQDTLRLWAGAIAKMFKRSAPPLTVSLSATEQLKGHGNKALRLSQIAAAKLPVPDGFVIPYSTILEFERNPKVLSDLRSKAVAVFGDQAVAVRSSASAEDGENQSFAGVFDSCLNVKPKDIEQAILRVAQSFKSQHAADYADGGGGNILVQRMVNAEFAGVLFTQNPTHPAQQILEWVKGTADDLVSGKVNPETVILGRLSGRIIAGSAPIDFAPLMKMAMRIEQIFGAPQDIEWVFEKGHFQIVQTRDITTPPAQTPVVTEWGNLVAHAQGRNLDDVFLEIDEMCETLPRPTPLSLSYMQRLWGWGGSVHLACENLGLTYRVSKQSPSHLRTIFGRLYVDKNLQSDRHVAMTRSVQKRLQKDPYEIENTYRNEILPHLAHQISVLEATAFCDMPSDVLRQQIVDMFETYISDIHVPVEQVNIVASYFVQSAQISAKRSGENLANIMSAKSELTPYGVLRFAGEMTVDERREVLRNHFGHRAPYDYELSDPRYGDNDDMMEVLVAASHVPDPKPARHKGRLTSELQEALARAESYQSLKDVAKHYSLGFLAQIKRAVDAFDQQLGLDGLAHYWTLDDLALPIETLKSQRLILERRRSERSTLLDMPALPVKLTPWHMEKASCPVTPEQSNQNGWSGTVVSGGKSAVGKIVKMSAKDADAGQSIIGFEQGDVLVCPYVHPSWIGHVIKAGAVVTEVGGWLSHMAIIAREHDVLMLVGVTGLETLESGIQVIVKPDGSIEPVQTEDHKIMAVG